MSETLHHKAEAPNTQPDFDMIIARHAQYYDMAWENEMYGRINDLPEHQKKSRIDYIESKIGRLNEEGEAQAKKLGLEVLEEALSYGEPVDITFIPSHQAYESPRYVDAPWAGRRAEETAHYAITAIFGRIEQMVEAGEINSNTVRVATPMPAEAFQPGDKPHERLVERDVFYSPKSDMSLVGAYRKRTQEIIEKEQAFGEPQTGGYDTLGGVITPAVELSNREKEIWARGQEDLDEFAAQIGNETSLDVAKRNFGVIDDVAELARLHHERSPERRLLAVIVSHDANIAALSHQGFGVENPVVPTFTGRLKIHFSGGEAHMEHDGKSYPRKISSSG